VNHVPIATPLRGLSYTLGRANPNASPTLTCILLNKVKYIGESDSIKPPSIGQTRNNLHRKMRYPKNGRRSIDLRFAKAGHVSLRSSSNLLHVS